MRISDLPAAHNYANIRLQLRQLQEGERKEPVSENNTGQAVFVKSFISSDNDYTKADALMKQWNKAGSFNLFDAMEGGTVPLQNPNPSADELKELEWQLQENGIQGQVDWSGLEFDLKGIGFDCADNGYTVEAGAFGRKVDYLASRYAAVKEQIQSRFSSGAREEQLEKLNQMYRDAAEEIASGYADRVGGFLEKNGVSGEREKIYRSVLAGIDEKAAGYEKLLSESKNLGGLKGTAEEWLLGDDEYVAAQLREEKGAPAVLDGQDESRYTLKDLDVLGQYVSALSSVEENPYSVIAFTKDEEQLGLEFAMLAMKTDALGKEGGVSDALNSTLKKVFQSYMEGFLDRMDRQLSEGRRAGVTAGDAVGFAQLDRDAVWDVYHKTIQEYQNTHDAVRAIIKGAEYGAALRRDKINTHAVDGVYRYKNSSVYWENFFDKNTQAGGAQSAYGKTGATYQRYLADWLDFKDNLSKDEAFQMNFMLKDVRQYELVELGNWLNKIV